MPLPNATQGDHGSDTDGYGTMTEPTAKTKLRTSNPMFAISAVQRYGKELRRYLFRRLGGPKEVDDLAQEVYVKLLRIGAELHLHKPLAFVHTVAARVLADHRTAAAQERAHLGCDRGSDDEPDRVSDALYERLEESLVVQRRIDRALAQISPRHASVLLMIKRDGMSCEEVATKLRLSVHTVHKYLQESRAQLRRHRWGQEAEE